MIELTVRLVASLAIVVGLLLLTVKLGGKRFAARAGAPVRVVHRQALSRGSAVAVVEVGNRVLVLGTTEHQVSLLTELDEDDLEDVGGAVLRLERPHAQDEDADEADDQDDEGADAFAPVLAAAVTDPTPEQSPQHATEHTTVRAPGARRRTGAHAANPAAPTTRATKPGARAARTTTKPGARAARPTADGALGGSVLSPDTWRQAVAAVRGRA